MAGRSLPGDAGRDERWLVDRQIYERRRDGMRYVAWSRSKQVGFVWLMALALVVAVSAGVGATLAWQRYGSDLIAFTQVERLLRAGAAWAGYDLPAHIAVPATGDGSSVVQTDLDAAQTRIATATSELDALRIDKGDGPDLASPIGKPADSPEDLRREVTMLRHERDAARQQIDALMQLTAQMKAELAQTQAGMVSGAALAAVPSAELEKALDRVARLEAELASARDAGKAATDSALFERDRARADLTEGQAAMKALQESYGRLADRAGEAERTLAARDGDFARLRGEAVAKVEAARLLEANVAALGAERETMRADLDRLQGERDAAVRDERARREERDAALARLQAAEGRWAAAGDQALFAAERDRLAAQVAELQAGADETRTDADAARQELARLRDELSGAVAEADHLRQSYRQLLATGAGGDAAKLAVTMPVSAAAAVGGASPALQAELVGALARIKDLDSRVAASERRNSELERYVAERAPPPSPPAPRRPPD